MPETTLHLVRHGQTQWNLEKRFQGHLNSPLTPTGQDQARNAGVALSETPIHHVYASPLPRTMETARLVVGHRSFDITPHPGLKEINLGPLEGVLFDEALKAYPEAAHNFWSAPHLFKVEGAETVFDVQARLMEALTAIAEAHTGQSILVVSHGMAIMTVLAHVMKLPMERLMELPLPGNGSITTVCLNGSRHWAMEPRQVEVP